MRKTPLITLFGGGGFVGRYIAEHLLAAGARIRIAERNPGSAIRIKPLGTLGQTQFVATDICKPETVARALQDADGAANLVGTLAGDFEAVHVDGARNVAKAAAEQGCEALVHLSAIGADPNSESRYGRSKAQGEEAVREAFPGATILRPSIIFGPEDQFVNRFAAMIRMLPLVPVIAPDTKFQPIFVDDVARAAAKALLEPADFAGRTFELGGPEALSMLELNRWIAEATGRRRGFIEIPDAASQALAAALGWAPGAPITRDQYKMLQRDNIVAEDAHSLADFGIRPTPLAAVTHDWLKRYRRHGRFGSKREAV